MLIAFYLLWFIPCHSVACITFLPVSSSNRRLALRRIEEVACRVFTMRTGHDEAPLKGLAVRQKYREKSLRSGVGGIGCRVKAYRSTHGECRGAIEKGGKSLPKLPTPF